MTCKTALLLLPVLLLIGCSTQKEIVVEYKEVKQNIAIAERKKMEKLYTVDFLTEESGNVILTEEENKKMLYNFFIMQKQLFHFRDIIEYYENSLKK